MQVWSHANWNFHYPQTADRRRLTALARDRNAAQKHVWRAEIVLLSADGVGSVIRALPDFSVGPSHALKRLSILASFCQSYNYK